MFDARSIDARRTKSDAAIITAVDLYICGAAAPRLSSAQRLTTQVEVKKLETTTITGKATIDSRRALEIKPQL